MIERAVAFGVTGALVGVLTEPDPADLIVGAPAALMWNVGIQHRIGPYRVQVDLARELARHGFISLRFDLSGMGDSDVRQDNRTDQERALDDVREAMTLLAKRRAIERFVPIGFCSSVDSVHALSITDERIVGACFIEGYAYRTPGFWLNYPLRTLDWMRWKRRIMRKLPMWISSVTSTSPLGAGAPADRIEEEPRTFGTIFARQYPSLKQFGLDVHRMAARGAQLLFIYVGGDTDFNHRGQFEEMIGGLPRSGGIEVTYYAGADHTFFRSADRRRAVTCVAEWATRTFAGARIAPANSTSIRPAVPSLVDPPV